LLEVRHELVHLGFGAQVQVHEFYLIGVHHHVVEVVRWSGAQATTASFFEVVVQKTFDFCYHLFWGDQHEVPVLDCCWGDLLRRRLVKPLDFMQAASHVYVERQVGRQQTGTHNHGRRQFSLQASCEFFSVSQAWEFLHQLNFVIH
jgi:hypothetical protein